MILNLNPEELSRNRVSVSVNYNAMVYITSWDEFVERSVQLFRADPDSVCSLISLWFTFLIFLTILCPLISLWFCR